MYNKFSKNMRLLTSKEFEFVFQKPKKIKIAGIALFGRINHIGFARIGLAISKKYVKHAYKRNKIKRYARETFRINQHNLSNMDFVITVYSKEILCLKNNLLKIIFEKLWFYYPSQ